MQALRPPFGIEGANLPMGDVPAVGQHTESVLHDLGYGTAEIDRLRDSGAI
jgi:formyl-CoA transferase